MQNELNAIIQDAKMQVVAAKDAAAIQDLRVKYLGKKGQLTDILKKLGQLDPQERPKAGQLINQAKEQVQAYLNEQESKLKNAELNARLASEKIDVTLMGRGQSSTGSMHPVTLVRQRVLDLFKQMGFTVASGPEIEDEYHNFSALNFVDHHPAKESQDTFYFADGRLLRTHTSPVQIRVMKKEKPPIRVITPGRVYRRDSDLTHTPMFHQLEGLVVDAHCTFANLKGLLQNFLNLFFEKEMPLRFRPGYFPFTEPSAEVDIGWGDDNATKWLEVLGCGMVHPNVLDNVGIDPKKYTAFAFGIGLDRLAMLRYGIHDLRMMFENDVRFLSQF
ncbi:MAG: phenylalanine--tRNA ligase subunit alpha [Gammaproteobacteria bacterium CG_4_10_14_0_8_um_filter_38_16]|nr:MAG: phenylalanine--tRNA ligase subunit alpha [Gammaproteobacteria bacterium CG_4_10_14_0_8_um_filter_38_16]PJA02691.1 MAG: phenylalanine--tRNA ligase subunit alpha [Gammaproteobacteria bacterium CG_4_10_14_0_2_um_filter_38_22]PJB09526.1 MAG: phenylalanine--tRNA ligase subunit alpha [Gammaproteobacteria bacterium CG_4_9_14_3_um_filter_38_9]